jgi:hypothetical protein
VPQYRVTAPAIWIDCDTDRLRDRKHTAGAVVKMTAKQAEPYIKWGQVEAIKPPKPDPIEMNDHVHINDETGLP